MISGGDELGRTQQGNNNAYCQDNEISWHHWDLDEQQQDFLDFTRRVIRLRKENPALHRKKFFDGIPGDDHQKDVTWLAPDGRELTRFQEDIQVEITRRRDEILANENGKIQNIIGEYAREHGFSVIFLRSEVQIYVDPSLDITQDIIGVYDERYPVAGAETADSSTP